MSAISPDIRLRHSFGDDDIDPPSPSATSRPIDIPPASSSYAHSWESVDFSQGGFAYTPSYVGSFGSNQGTSWGDREQTAVYNGADNLFDDAKYEPEAYHNSHSPHLMMDDQSAFVSVPNVQDQSLFPDASSIAVSYHDQDHHFSPRRDVFNAASPASSIGIADNGAVLNEQGQPRSRASSMSSNHGAQSSPYLMSSDYPLYDNFTKALSLDASPAWNHQQGPLSNISRTVPSTDFQSPDMSPSNKPLSPPSLLIPTETPGGLMPPAHNLPGAKPASNDGGHQPAINLVPATPISGGGLGSTNQPFQQVLANLNRQRAAAAAAAGQNAPFSRGNTPAAEAVPSIANYQASLETNLVGSSAAVGTQSQGDAMTWSSIISASGQSQGTAPNTLPPSSNSVYHHGYNVPVIPDFATSQQRRPLAMQMANSNALPHHPQSDSSIHTIHQLASFPNPSDSALDNLAFTSESALLSAPSLTRNRSKSDTSSRPPMWLTNPPDTSALATTDVSSFASTSAYNFNFPMNRQPLPSIFPPASDQDLLLGTGETSIRRSNSDGGRHKRGVKSEDLSSIRGPRLVPTSNSDFIRSVTAADGSLAPVDPRSGGGGPGPQRRRNSGSGHDRTPSLSSVRSTPYQRPSPHTSPGQSPHHSPTPASTPLPGSAQQAENYARVERPLVTTPATKTASANRRRAEASFVCPVPGCGSTFTRHFNLRGHLRSHNEERPFKCKWPGCEKGFARQHDCKRHEALHLNIRPYTCEGCQKTFARMDALNRHLRSEGGVDCQKVHQPTDGSPPNPGEAALPKVEIESSPWVQSGALVM